MKLPMNIDQRLQELGIVLPEPVRPVAAYVRYVQTGNLLFISGTGPGPEIPTGKLGADMSLEDGYAAARSTGLSILATAKDALGDLNRIKRLVKLLGMVNATPDYTDHPLVINGCSELFVEVFGESGYGTRAAVGFVSLPGGIPVEIECTFEVE